MGGNVPHPDIYGNENNYMLGGGVPHPNIYNENQGFREIKDFKASQGAYQTSPNTSGVIWAEEER